MTRAAGGLRALSVGSAAALALVVAAAPGRVAAQDAQDPPADPGAALAAATKDYERRLGTTLRSSARGRFVVRGDNEQPDLDGLAEVCRSTWDHYLGAMGCKEEDVLRPARKGETPWVEVFQFVREKGYHDFIDKVVARVRDDTVDDKRLALMRRQRGMFVLTPRTIVAQYQGPSEMSTVRSQAVHKTSHVLLLSHRRAGAWMPWWFLEGVATWEEMAVLKESRTYCLEVERPGDYAKAGTPEADEAAKARLESAWRKRARELVAGRQARDLRVLAGLALNELKFEDVIQSWSIVDWMARSGKLPAFTLAYKEKREFSAACEAALGGPPADVEQRWQAAVLAGR